MQNGSTEHSDSGSGGTNEENDLCALFASLMVSKLTTADDLLKLGFTADEIGSAAARESGSAPSPLQRRAPAPLFRRPTDGAFGGTFRSSSSDLAATFDAMRRAHGSRAAPTAAAATGEALWGQRKRRAPTPLSGAEEGHADSSTDEETEEEEEEEEEGTAWVARATPVNTAGCVFAASPCALGSDLRPRGAWRRAPGKENVPPSESQSVGPASPYAAGSCGAACENENEEGEEGESGKQARVRGGRSDGATRTRKRPGTEAERLTHLRESRASADFSAKSASALRRQNQQLQQEQREGERQRGRDAYEPKAVSRALFSPFTAEDDLSSSTTAAVPLAAAACGGALAPSEPSTAAAPRNTAMQFTWRDIEVAERIARALAESGREEGEGPDDAGGATHGQGHASQLWRDDVCWEDL